MLKDKKPAEETGRKTTPQEPDADEKGGNRAKKRLPAGLVNRLPLVFAILGILCLVISAAPLALIFSVVALVLIFRDKERRRKLLTRGSATLICAVIVASCSVYALGAAPTSRNAPADTTPQSEPVTSAEDKAEPAAKEDEDEPALEGGMVTISLSVEDWTGTDTAGTVTVSGTTDDGDAVQDSIALLPGDERLLYYEPGSYTLAVDSAPFSTEDVIYASLSRTITVGSKDLAVSLAVKKDAEAIAAKQAEKAAAEEAQRQAEEAAAQEAQRQAEEAAAQEAQRQAEAAAEAQRQAEAAAAAQAQQQTQQNEQTVYITGTGSKYHRDGCQYLRKSKHAISLSDAEARGYTPCSKCF